MATTALRVSTPTVWICEAGRMNPDDPVSGSSATFKIVNNNRTTRSTYLSCFVLMCDVRVSVPASTYLSCKSRECLLPRRPSHHCPRLPGRGPWPHCPQCNLGPWLGLQHFPASSARTLWSGPVCRSPYNVIFFTVP